MSLGISGRVYHFTVPDGMGVYQRAYCETAARMFECLLFFDAVNAGVMCYLLFDIPLHAPRGA